MELSCTAARSDFRCATASGVDGIGQWIAEAPLMQLEEMTQRSLERET